MSDIPKDRRLYDCVRWRKASKRYLSNNPLCTMHQQEGFSRIATVVDHIKPHNGNVDLFWDEDNWQGLCAPCHSGRKRMFENKGTSPACGENGLPLDIRRGWGVGKSLEANGN